MLTLYRIRPGAAVRLRGTWIDEVKRAPFQDDAQSGDSTLEVNSKHISHTPGSTSVPGTSSTTSNVQALDQVSGAPKTTTAELQVTEVEILGPSDPQVSYRHATSHLHL